MRWIDVQYHEEVETGKKVLVHSFANVWGDKRGTFRRGSVVTLVPILGKMLSSTVAQLLLENVVTLTRHVWSSTV